MREPRDVEVTYTREVNGVSAHPTVELKLTKGYSIENDIKPLLEGRDKYFVKIDSVKDTTRKPWTHYGSRS